MNEIIKDFDDFLELENRLQCTTPETDLLREFSQISSLQVEELAEQARVIHGGLRALPNK